MAQHQYDQDLPYKIRKKVNLKICLAALDSNEEAEIIAFCHKKMLSPGRRLSYTTHSATKWVYGPRDDNDS